MNSFRGNIVPSTVGESCSYVPYLDCLSFGYVGQVDPWSDLSGYPFGSYSTDCNAMAGQSFPYYIYPGYFGDFNPPLTLGTAYYMEVYEGYTCHLFGTTT